MILDDIFVPSALQIVRESELASPPNKRRKKLQKYENIQISTILLNVD